MSLAATLRPTNLPFASAIPSGVYGYGSESKNATTSFRHDSNYLALTRMLTRYQNLILLIPSPNAGSSLSNSDIVGLDNGGNNNDDLTPLQKRIQAELFSSLPYHRNKWLHNVQAARDLLLQLEKQAQAIKVQRTKKEMLKDLGEKRRVIRLLRNRIEEIGREVERTSDGRNGRHDDDDADEILGERADEILNRMRRQRDKERNAQDDDLHEGKPVNDLLPEDGPKANEKTDEQEQREALLGPSSLRRRNAGDSTSAGPDPTSNTTTTGSPSATNKGTTSGFSNLKETEKQLDQQTKTHEDLTTSLVSMAAQLKQQARAFQFSLDQDKNLLDLALEGLDRNVSALDIASRNMAFLTRMSEGEGWWGRMKLYGMIFGMWIFAILLVFLFPKLRF